VWILAQGRSRSRSPRSVDSSPGTESDCRIPDFFKILKSESELYQKRRLRIDRTCFHNLREYSDSV